MPPLMSAKNCDWLILKPSSKFSSTLRSPDLIELFDLSRFFESFEDKADDRLISLSVAIG